MYLSKKEQLENIIRETTKFWELSSSFDHKQITNCMIGFTQTIESGELANYMNDNLYNDLLSALKNINMGISNRNESLIFSNLTSLLKAITHLPSIKAMLG